MNISTSTSAPSPSSFLPPSQPPLPQQQHQDEQQTMKGARACHQVLQGALTLSSMPVEGISQLLGGMMALQGRGDATATMPALRTLRDAFDHVLGDGASSESAKRKQVDAAEDNNISTTPSTACAQVLRSKPGHLLTCIIGWLFHERHTLPSRVALGQTAPVSKEWCHISRQTCFWRPLVGALLPSVGANDESMVQGRGCKGYFDCLCNYGKCLAERPVRC